MVDAERERFGARPAHPTAKQAGWLDPEADGCDSHDDMGWRTNRIDRPSLRESAWAWLPLLLCAALYVGTLTYGTVTDDRPLITENPLLRDGADPATLIAQDIGGARSISPYYRPLPMLAFWLQVQTTGVDTRFLHAGNILLFGLCARLLFSLLLTQWPALRPSRAALVTCAWVAHPLQTEPVIWLSGRFDLFLLLGTLFVLQSNLSERRTWAVSASLAFALLSKEVAVVLPFVVLVQDFEARRSFANESRKYVGMAVTLVVYAALRHAAGIDTVSGTMEAIGSGTLLRSYATLLATFVRLLVLPWGLDVHHWYRPFGWISTCAVGGAALIMAASVLVETRKSTSRAGVASGLLLGLSSLAPIALVGPAQLLFGDRFASLLLLGLAIAAPALSVRRGFVWLFVGLICLWIPLQQLRAREWFSEATLREAALSREPDNPHWRLMKGLSLLEQAQPLAGALVFRTLVADEPNYGKAWQLSCIAELRVARLDAAALACRRALTMDSDNPNTWVNYASVLVNQRSWAAAERAAEHALALRSVYPEAHYLAALAAANQGALEKAQKHVERGLAAAPDHAGLGELDVRLRSRRAQ